MNMKIQSDFSYCEAIIKKHSTSFYYAFSQLPKDKANAVYAIYAFCRIADDSVDENNSTLKRIVALKKLEDELDLFDLGKEKDEPLWRALRIVFDRFDMDIEPFYDQIRGQEMDIEFESPKTMLELEQYSYYVAGSVGLMLLPIIASEYQHELKRTAVDLGVAMQITNVLRDIGEDYFDKQRIYLPESELSRFNYTANDLSACVINESFINVWEELATRAEVLYARFSDHVHKFDADSHGPVSLSALVYEGILGSVRENQYNCLSQRNYVNKAKMTEISASVGG